MLRFACSALVLAGACGGNRAFEVPLVRLPEFDVELTTDLAVPKDVDSISVLLAGSSHPRLFELGPAGLVFPATLTSEPIGLAPSQGGAAPPQTIDVTVAAWKGSTPFTVIRAVGAVPSASDDRVMRMSLSWLCAGTAREVSPGQLESTCPQGQSCRAGLCQANDRSAEAPPAYDPQVRPPCFDVARCLASGSPIAVDAATCTASSGGATNLAAIEPPGAEGFCTTASCLVPLSSDPVEGWHQSAGTIALPKAVCAALASGRATAVIASSACPTWAPEQRLCAAAP